MRIEQGDEDQASNNLEGKRNPASSDPNKKIGARVNAIVLAGGKIKDFKEIGYKAFLPMGNKKMLDYIIRALRNSQTVSNITVTSIPREERLKENGFSIKPTKRDIVSSIANALEGLPEEKTLLVASDIPLTSSEIIDHFVESCSESEADLYYPLIPKEEVMKKYPTTKRTYFTLKEGTFTGGNIILISNKKFLANIELAKQIYADRKKPVKIVKILGPKFLIRFVAKNLPMKDAEAKASIVINGKVKGIVFPFPEVGTDVDKKSDYELVKALIGNERD